MISSDKSGSCILSESSRQILIDSTISNQLYEPYPATSSPKDSKTLKHNESSPKLSSRHHLLSVIISHPKEYRSHKSSINSNKSAYKFIIILKIYLHVLLYLMTTLKQIAHTFLTMISSGAIEQAFDQYTDTNLIHHNQYT